MNKIYTLLTVVCLLSNNVYADCDTTANMHYPSVVPPNYQGSAHTDSFDCAINGARQLTTEELRERADLIPPSMDNRFYIRLGATAAAEGITSVKNTQANNTTTNITGTLQNLKLKVADNNFAIALGYTWKEFAIDLEWLPSKSIDYSTAVNNVTPTFNVYSTITGDTLLFNIYWFFNDMYNVKLYGDLIVGYSHNTSNTYISGGTITTTNRYYPAYGLGIGGRFNIISSLFADLSGRYIILGNAKMQAIYGANNAFLKGSRTWLGATVCLLWLF